MQERLYNQIIYSNKLIRKTFRKGEILFFQDDCPTHSYIVKKGKIRLYTQNEKNETMTIFQYNKKDHCPISILSLLSAKPTIATAEVLEDTEVYIVTKKMLNELLLNNATYQPIP
jgi:CRP/FNR family transcriptional regulator